MCQSKVHYVESLICLEEKRSFFSNPARQGSLHLCFILFACSSVRSAPTWCWSKASLSSPAASTCCLTTIPSPSTRCRHARWTRSGTGVKRSSVLSWRTITARFQRRRSTSWWTWTSWSRPELRAAPPVVVFVGNPPPPLCRWAAATVLRRAADPQSTERLCRQLPRDLVLPRWRWWKTCRRCGRSAKICTRRCGRNGSPGILPFTPAPVRRRRRKRSRVSYETDLWFIIFRHTCTSKESVVQIQTILCAKCKNCRSKAKGLKSEKYST